MGCSIQGDAIFDGHAGRVFQGQTAGYILFLGLRSVGQPTFSTPHCSSMSALAGSLLVVSSGYGDKEATPAFNKKSMWSVNFS